MPGLTVPTLVNTIAREMVSFLFLGIRKSILATSEHQIPYITVAGDNAHNCEQ